MGNLDPHILEEIDLDTADEPVVRLLNTLERVEPPNDFDMRVRARIAAGRPADRQVSWLPPSLRYAVPLVLLLLVGGYFAISNYYSSKNVDVPPVAESRPPIVTLPDDKTAITVPEAPSPETLAVKQPDQSNKDLGPPSRKTGSSFDSSDDRPKSGSALGLKVDVPIRPRGLEGNTTVLTNSNGIVRSTSISARDLFDILGIKGTFDMTGWKVDAVGANTTAERSGVKTGDVIEAVNDQRLTAKTSFGSNFNGKSLRIRRDGRTIKIDLVH